MIWYRGCLLWGVVIMVLNVGKASQESTEFLCGKIPIRCPFQVADGVSDHFAYRLSCERNLTFLHLPSHSHSLPITLRVTHIDYEFHYLIATAPPDNCLTSLFLKLHNSSFFPFQFDSYPSPSNNITFFHCSSLRSQYCPVALDFQDSVYMLDGPLPCTRAFDLLSSPVSARDLQDDKRLYLTWSTPTCDHAHQSIYRNHKPSKTPRILVTSIGSPLVLLLLIAFFLTYRHFKKKGQDEARVEQFLEDYRALQPTRFSYADLKQITNNFKHKIGEGAHGVVYKGQLSSEILVAVKMLNNSQGDGKEFINEVGTMGKIHHINVVRLLGFCADGFYRALVYSFFPNGSLQNFISPPHDKDKFLGWNKLQQIALGIARGIDYLHQGCDHRILHFDINPHNVLLDNNFTPKISDFGLAKLCSKNRSTVSMTAIRGTIGYIAPEVFSRNFGNVSYKSDIYSYGMLVLEMVGGRKNTQKNQEDYQVLYPEWIHHLVEGGEMQIDVEDDADNNVARKLAIVGLWCIQWHPVNRPSMKKVMEMLEGEAEKLKVPPAPFDTPISTNTSANTPTSSTNRLSLHLEVIHELD